jgi:serine phosphatase RsbU (regulator of sigma subunit)
VGGTVIGPLTGSSFRRGIARLDPGDVLLMCTDGILERRDSGPDFGDERLRGIVAENRQASARELLDALFEEAGTHGGARSWEDDATVVVVKRPLAP